MFIFGFLFAQLLCWLSKMQRSFTNVCVSRLPNHLVLSWTCEWYILYSLISLRFFCSCVQCLDQTRINMHIIPIYHTYFTKLVVSFNWCAIRSLSEIEFPSAALLKCLELEPSSFRWGVPCGKWRVFSVIGLIFFMVGGKQVKHVFFHVNKMLAYVSINVARFRYWMVLVAPFGGLENQFVHSKMDL